MIFKYSILILLFAGISFFGVTSLRQGGSPVRKTPVDKRSITMKSSLNFDTDIKPIFEKHCNPCHFPGGKLYDRLPFDQASTITKNEEGILRRIKDADEVKLIRQFVAENKPVTHSR